MSNTIAKPIKAVLALSKLTPKDLLAFANIINDGVFNDPAFATLSPPVDKATFQGGIVTYVSLSTEA